MTSYLLTGPVGEPVSLVEAKAFLKVDDTAEDGLITTLIAAARLHIDSAGTHNYRIGDQPDPRSAAFAAQRGYDLTALRARQVNQADFADFDHIFAMDNENLASLQKVCPPEHRHKLGLFMQFATQSDSDIVPDPYQGDDGGFDMVLDYIEDASDGLLERLRSKHAETI